jgi:PPOX class probable F420-dependent enzyme
MRRLPWLVADAASCTCWRTTMERSAELLEPFDRQRTISLETQRRNGTWVATPVNIVVDGDHAYFRTWSTAGKAKRLRNFPDVHFAPSTTLGKPTGPSISATARLVTGEDERRAAQLLHRKYRVLQGKLVPLSHRIMRYQTQHYELTDVRPRIAPDL